MIGRDTADIEAICRRRMDLLQDILASFPDIIARLAAGQQFNAYDAADNPDDATDEDCVMHVCLGPVTDMRHVATVDGHSTGNLLAHALTLAAYMWALSK